MGVSLGLGASGKGSQHFRTTIEVCNDHEPRWFVDQAVDSREIFAGMSLTLRTLSIAARYMKNRRSGLKSTEQP